MARRPFRSSGSRRQTSWASIGVIQTTVDGSASLASSGNAALLALRPFTIVRTHLEILLQSDQLAVTEAQVAAVGLMVGSDSAIAAGVASVPTPLTELESDLWYVHQTMLNSIDIAGTVSIGDTAAGRRYTVDSKAMRKVNNDQDIALVVEGSGTGDGCLVTTIGRFLIKLH